MSSKQSAVPHFAYTIQYQKENSFLKIISLIALHNWTIGSQLHISSQFPVIRVGRELEAYSCKCRWAHLLSILHLQFPQLTYQVTYQVRPHLI